MLSKLLERNSTMLMITLKALHFWKIPRNLQIKNQLFSEDYKLIFKNAFDRKQFLMIIMI